VSTLKIKMKRNIEGKKVSWEADRFKENKKKRRRRRGEGGASKPNVNVETGGGGRI